MQNIKMKITLVLGLALVALMVSGSSLSSGSAMRATSQTLPSCTDPTGQNLRCMMVVSTLPPPPNALQCQETSGQLLPCSYTTQSLSNGEQIVAITVYVPANYIFSSPTEIKVVVHTTTTKVIRKVVVVPRPGLSAADLKILEFGRMDGKAGIYDLGAACAGLSGKGFDRCSFLYRTAYVLTCVHGPNGCGDGPTTLPPPPSSLCAEGGYSGPKIINPIFRCAPPGVVPPPNPSCDSKYYTGPCPPTDSNALTKCISAALVANDNKGVLGCATLLPDTPENAVTKCISAGLLANDNIAVLKCAKLLPSTNGAGHNMTTLATIPPSNTSAAIQTTNTSTTKSPSAKSGPRCTDNCTTSTPPSIDCKKNPTDPSCTQTLTPSTTTPPSTSGTPTSPTTKTCPDGSVIDANANCPTPPSTPSNPPNNPNTITPPPSIPPTPPPSDNGNPSGGSGSSNGGGSSGGGSSPPQPSTSS